jgi:hypothetical protein
VCTSEGSLIEPTSRSRDWLSRTTLCPHRGESGNSRGGLKKFIPGFNIPLRCVCGGRRLSTTLWCGRRPLATSPTR